MSPLPILPAWSFRGGPADIQPRSFALILNEPAGQVAILVIKHAVELVVKAWEDQSMDPNAVASQSKPLTTPNIGVPLLQREGLLTP